jgi:chemotaxis protein histidine kinase CheA
VRRRYREPVVIAFTLALIASLLVHFPVYEVLGDLADRWRTEAEEARKARKFDPVEVDFELADTTKSQRSRNAPREREQAKREQAKREQIAQIVQEQEQAQQQAERAEKPEQPRIDSPQAVQQHSTNPEVKPPDNPQFVAEENNRVEEETVARIRNMIRDDKTPSPGQQQKPSDTLEEEGNAREQEIAEARNKEGSEARKVTEEEASRQRPDKAIQADPIKAERVSRATPDGKQAATSSDQASQAADETITITDAAGTFSIRRPSNAGQGGGKRAGGQGPGGKLSWSQFEGAVGSDKLEQDRRAYLAERKSSQRGIAREKSWNEFRAAIENYAPGVKPGATTALNAAASPFATYVAAVHRRIHQEFADRFLRSLPIGGSPYQDDTLMTKLEIVLNRDGSVHRVGVVRSSGLLPFDFGAFNSVLRGQPYPEAPSSILSGDGRVYIHWGFYRNQRQCGTFNAEPYILPNPRGTPARKDGLTDEPDWDTVVPADARPTWRMGGEGSDDGDDKPKQPPKKSPPAQPKEQEKEAPDAVREGPGSGMG